MYLDEFNSTKYGPLHKQPWVKEEIMRFHRNVREYYSLYCNNCSELWPTTKSKCETCELYGQKFNTTNDMNPLHNNLELSIKTDLYDLTMIEEMLISPILPIMSIYRLSGGQLVSKGSVINFKQDITSIVTSLPRLINDLPVLVAKNNGVKINQKNLKSTKKE